MESNYGNCPICSSPVVSRERRLNGNDMCANKHQYPSRLSMSPKEEKIETSWKPVTENLREKFILLKHRSSGQIFHARYNHSKNEKEYFYSSLNFGEDFLCTTHSLESAEWEWRKVPT